MWRISTPRSNLKAHKFLTSDSHATAVLRLDVRPHDVAIVCLTLARWNAVEAWVRSLGLRVQDFGFTEVGMSIRK